MATSPGHPSITRAFAIAPPIGQRVRALSAAHEALVGALGLSLALIAQAAEAQPTRRIIHADVVALDQMLVYNRFGSYNPYGMMFALSRDVSSLDQSTGKASPDCAADDGTRPGTGSFHAGAVRLKDCKRPRPLVLRAAVGDVLEVKVTNLLRTAQPGFSRTWCGDGQSGAGTPPTRAELRAASQAQCNEPAAAPGAGAGAEGTDADWPRTRGLSFVVPGLAPVALTPGEAVDPICLGLSGAAPGASFICRYQLEREGTHLFSSLAAPAGGEGDAGSLTHGLFGALVVEPAGATMLRSQVSAAAFEAAWAQSGTRHARLGSPRYDATVPATATDPARPPGLDCGAARVPVLDMLRPCGTRQVGGETYALAELVHADLNAIVVPPGLSEPRDGEDGDEDARTARRLERQARMPFREFTVIFHDELKTYYADGFRELNAFGQLSGVRDGFAINYGSSGAGTMILANRKGVGPAANCPECLYEEFFLESWANGDPALLERYADDPSNVHHSYLNDKVVFRNFHAGKETHVFHLHTHQWFAGNDENRGSYLDSQTIGPQQGFTYHIYRGGQDRHRPDGAPARGYWEGGKGSGNRNRTVGDAIFHCHLYPHFAQGMWSLWRVHDVLEDGTRALPDGQAVPGLSLTPTTGSPRRGSVDPANGAWLGSGAGHGTPVPGLVPIPGEATPLLPTYAAADTPAKDADGMPGYPFYIAGLPGHRAPQPPLDMAREGTDQLLDGGLPRHVVAGGLALPSVLTEAERAAASTDPGTISGLRNQLVGRMLALGDATSEFEHLTLRLLPHEGTRLEQNAMGFHHDGQRPGGGPLALLRADGTPAPPQVEGGYETARTPLLAPGAPSASALFTVNGAAPAPGAPFADPCGAPTTMKDRPFRRFVGARGDAGLGTVHDAFEQAAFAATPDPLLTDAGGGDAFLSALRGTLNFVPDPGLIGLRRYRVSAVQLDMTVNRAGWHDPQARVAVLSAEADRWKEARTARAEPFFFRAFSGECVELRHTNELPKDLELDDFQLKVPTDTIGQHIHLVKFDVTASDGSGNGFNYEDGTFAADELLARICAARSPGGGIEGASTTRRVADRIGECAALKSAKAAYAAAVAARDPAAIAAARAQLRAAQLWWRKGEANRRTYFQTTIQRWFADPILSNTGDGRAADRTLRTVFTHDHFAPSNIQQHGYYAALLIEPNTHVVERFSGPEDGTAKVGAEVDPPEPAPAGGVGWTPAFADTGAALVGPRATVRAKLAPRRPDGTEREDGDPIHPDAREYALAIADFAVLYDGRGQERASVDGEGEVKGLRRLVLEAHCGIQTVDQAGLAADPDLEEGERIPARRGGLCIAPSGGAPGDGPGHVQAGIPNPAHAGQVVALETHARDWRARHGRPVAPPPRPEAISQKHHDPYLVNYRNEPLPLRLGTRSRNGAPFAFAANPCAVDAGPVGAAGLPDNEPVRPHRQDHGDVRHQLAGERGNFANVFRSLWEGGEGGSVEGHGDPCTPLVEAYGDERLVVRMVQGAQEVQHTFRIEGAPFRRNVDQAYPSARAHLSLAPGALRPRGEHCQDHPVARAGRPREFQDWASGRLENVPFWRDFEAIAGGCDNVLGLTAAQEIGISEHFELGGSFRSETPLMRFRRFPGGLDAASAPRRPYTRNLQRNMSGTAPTLNADALTDLQVSLRPLGPGAVRPAADARGALDYQYSYGSTDALWNGAWGLIRIYDGPRAPDVARCLIEPGRASECLGTTAAVGERLAPLPIRTFALARAGGGGPSQPPAEIEAPPAVAAAQTLACPSPAASPQVEAVMIAVRAGEVLDKSGGDGIALPGAPYDRAAGLYDPDALFITALSLRELAAGGGSPATIHELLRDHGGIPSRADIIARVRAKLSGRPRPFPYVLRVNAGDCVTVLMINALPSEPGGIALRDTPGDALMPRIVPLNTDPSQTGAPGDGVRPSSRVVFTLPASVTSPRDGVPLPFGINRARALASPDEAADASWRTVTFYAGSLHVDSKRLGDALDGRAFTVTHAGVSHPIPLRHRGATACAAGQVELAVLGVLFCADVPSGVPLSFTDGAGDADAENAAQLAGAIMALLAGAQDEIVKAVPYAFGALPIRVAGDVVGHASHGLSGTLVVEPRGSTLEDRVRVEAVASDHYISEARSVPAPPGGVIPISLPAAPEAPMPGLLIDVPAVEPCGSVSPCQAIPAATIREHTLLFQDGLNLWSRTWSRAARESAPRDPPVPWGYDAGVDRPWAPSLPPSQRGYPGHPLPDCRVCDDSYDRGERGIGYRTAPFARRLAGWGGSVWLGIADYPRDGADLNAALFPLDFFASTHPVPTPRLLARPNEEVVIRIAHPAGRARQRAFLMMGHSYEDLLPGFGSGHSGLIGPGKALTASTCAASDAGEYLYRDGPQHIFAGGVWGHLAVGSAAPGSASPCRP